jgi:hypothetical protein
MEKKKKKIKPPKEKRGFFFIEKCFAPFVTPAWRGSLFQDCSLCALFINALTKSFAYRSFDQEAWFLTHEYFLYTKVCWSTLFFFFFF